jgi:hypothetical protein
MPCGITAPTITVCWGTIVGLKAGSEPPATKVLSTAKANKTETAT